VVKSELAFIFQSRSFVDEVGNLKLERVMPLLGIQVSQSIKKSELVYMTIENLKSFIEEVRTITTMVNSFIDLQILA
jgi:hypothetical protein